MNTHSIHTLSLVWCPCEEGSTGFSSCSLHQLLPVTLNAKAAREYARVMDVVFVGGDGLDLMRHTSCLGQTKIGYW